VEEITLAQVGATATFRGVEIAQATLSLNGQSAVQDVAVFTQNLVKPLEGGGGSTAATYVKEVSIDMESGSARVFLKTTFVPSNDDLRRLLYEQLNEATQRKAAAREALRSSTGELASPGSGNKKGKKSVSFSSSSDKTSNKKEQPPLPSKLLEWFQMAVTIVPRVKNYIFFAAFVIASNYRGHLLALPEPV
jgi:hypothetical protein